MTTAHVLGFPRLGAQRELLSATEAFWQGARDDAAHAALERVGKTLRERHWALQREAGLDFVSTGDFTYYDGVLDTLAHLGALPTRFGFDAARLTRAAYFEMARGNAHQPALETTRWFDTQYHYLVPELTPDLAFGPGVRWWQVEAAQARAAGHAAKAVLVGPLTLLWLGKQGEAATHATAAERLVYLPRVLEAYRRVLAELHSAGAAWVQIDEPIFALDLDPAWLDAARTAYAELAAGPARLLLATYFGSVERHAGLLRGLPVDGLHIDAVLAPEQVDTFAAGWPAAKVLSIGIVDGRNVWRHDLDASLARLAPVRAALGERLWIGSSCSLLHVPVDLRDEPRLDPELRSWLAFATQKLDELAALRQ
ncbi:MAG: 5-methyltetrahydropteroyltriglutamate--homocysteine S-methyltransferase, partial [Pararobbsia sp.]